MSAGSGKLSRADLLRRAGAAAATIGVAGTSAPFAFAGPHRHTGRWLAGDLSVVQWAHFVPGYNGWFRTWARAWGEENDVDVAIDLEVYTLLPELAAAEAKAKRGHDIFGFLSPPARYEDHVIDHRGIVREIEGKVGPCAEIGEKSSYNPRTRRYFGVSDYHVPAPLIWRHDLWNELGRSPATWEHVREAAAPLKASGHPLGIGLSPEPDSNVALLSLMACFGSFLQDESGMPTLESESTVEAVEFMADLHARGGDGTVFGWNATSNNQHVLSGRGSLIVNAISPIRRAEGLGLPFADDLWIWPIPRGPRGRLAMGQYTSVYAVWKFARNREAAEQFLADLCLAAKDATTASEFFNYPSFPGAYPVEGIYKAAAADPHAPKGKYSILTTVASRYTANVGYPGHANGAVQEALDAYLIPRMFAEVAQGRTSAHDAVGAAGRQTRAIWRNWRAAGKI